jgi:hypothetical protein
VPDDCLRRALLLAVAATVAAPAAPSARAAERGSIEGRVLNETTGEPQPGARVILTTARDDGSGGRRLRTTTDSRGSFRFDGLATGDDRFYAVDARFDGGLFAGGVVRLPEDTRIPPVVETKLRVWDTTTDPRSIVVGRDSLFVVPVDEGAGVIEALQVTNVSEQAYVGRGRALGAERDGAVASLGFAVPAGAEIPATPIVDSDLDIPGVVETSFGFAVTTAIPPGEWRIVYSYNVRGDGGTYDLSRPVLYPTLELSVYAADPLTVDGNRVAPDGTETVDGKTYDVYSASETMDAGDRLEMVAIARAPAGSLLAVGGAVAAIVLGAAGIVVLLRRQGRRAVPAERSRDDLVEAIARLDLAREQGLVAEAEWGPRREALKRELERTS